jgi:hypothetical protein
MSQRAFLEEYNRRQKAKEAAEDIIKAIRAELFDKQLAFVDDSSRNKVALCTRRAGKTSMWCRYATQVALRTPRSLTRIWASSRLRAKQLLWTEFQYLFQRHKMSFEEQHMHDTELTIRFTNGSEIRLLGADKDKEAQKKRGDKTIMEVVLEAQNFGPFLRTLVEEVAEPCLFDMRGTFCMEGTPGPICSGYWFDASGREDSAQRWTSVGGKDSVGTGWSCHRWSVLDNPYVPHAKDELALTKKKRRWADDNPTYVREWLGKWVNDTSVLFYAYDEKRNLYDTSKIQPWGPGWSHSLGWDLGSLDSMALVVWGWHPDYPHLFEAHSWKRPGTELAGGAADVMAEIDMLEKQGFNFVKKVADTGGGGRMYVEEVQLRYNHVFEAAKKTDKYEHVMLFNDDLRTGKIKLVPGSPLQVELSELPKDPNWPDEYPPGAPPKEDPRFDNHDCFVAGTMISTALGDRPIESIREGDMVWTRGGLRPVVRAWLTGPKKVIEAHGLVGTPEHPIWTKNRGWVRLDNLTSADVLLYACEQPWWKQSSGTGTSGGAGQTVNGSQIGHTSNATNREKTCTCTGKFGAPCVGASQGTTMCTTSTGILETTASKTSNVYRGACTCPDICEQPWAPKKGEKNTPHHWRRQSPPPPNGTVQTLGEHGTGHMQGMWQQLGRMWSWCVQFAGKALNLKSRPLKCAATPVTRKNAETAALTILTSRAPTVPGCLEQTSTPAESVAPPRVLPVFALSVDGRHEYFANGVLVSNCDAGLYAWRAAQYFFFKEKEPTVLRGSAKFYSKEEAKMLEQVANKGAKNGRDWWEPETDFGDDVGGGDFD